MFKRIKKAAALAGRKNLDAVLICGKENIRYFTGFTGEEAHLILSADKIYFFTDFRYMEQAQSELKELENAKIIMTTGKERLKAVFDTISEIKAKTIGIDEKSVTLDLFENFKQFIDKENISFFNGGIESLRSVKDGHELSCIAKAAKETDMAFEYILKFLKPGVSEIEIDAELRYYFNKKGLKVSFPPVVVSGGNASYPHGQPSGRLLQSGDAVTLDFGCMVNGYCSDFTRSVFLSSAGDEERKIYETVLRSQLCALDNLRAGIEAKTLDNFARKVIIDKGYKDCFGHGLGHGVGLNIHEAPAINPESEDVLRENMVITVEPGIYIAGRFGIRIEDLCVVKKDGFVNLTASNKGLMIL